MRSAIAASVCLLSLGVVGYAQEILRPGETLEGEIVEGSPRVETPLLSGSAAPVVGERFRLVLEEGGVYTLELHSWYVDAYLVLRDASGRVLAEDDDGFYGTHAQLETPRLVEGETYFVEACSIRDTTGAFDLTLRPGAARRLSPPEQTEAKLEDLRRWAEFHEAAGTEPGELGKAWNQYGLALYEAGRYGPLQEVWERCLELSQEAHGLQHADTATALNNLGALHRVTGNLDLSKEYFERALAVRRELFGEEHLVTAEGLHNLGTLYQSSGDYPRARDYLSQAIAIEEKLLGPDHYDLTTALENLAVTLNHLGELERSRSLFERVLAMGESELGPNHPSVATTLHNLSAVLEGLGEFDEARALSRRALDIRQEALGSSHPLTGINLATHGRILLQQGEYQAAQEHLEHGIDLLEGSLGPDHPVTASARTSLGVVLHDRGDLVAARACHERALADLERVLGPGHPDTSASLINLAAVLRSQGDLLGARPYYSRALAVREQVYGPDHPQTAVSLSNLAGLLQQAKDLAGARAAYERALAILEASLEPGHPTTAAIASNLANVLRAQGDLEGCRATLERARSVLEQGGAGHRHLATTLNNLGTLLRAQGKLDEARPHLQRAFDLGRAGLGSAHPETIRYRRDLALALVDAGELDRARALVLEGAEGMRAHLRHTLMGLTEAESFEYLAQLHRSQELILSLCAAGDAAQVSAGYASALFWKGQVGRTLVASRWRLAADLTDEQREAVDRLQAIQARLSRLLSEGGELGGGAPLVALREERNALELELARSIETPAEEAATPARLRASLRPGEALLDFLVHCQYTTGGVWKEHQVVAWIVRPERAADEGEADGPGIVRVDLGPQAVIAERIRASLEELVARRGAALPGGEGPSSAEALRRVLWEPLAEHLAGVETLFVSPDSSLGTLPFEILEPEDGRFLVEELGIVYLSDVGTLVQRDARPAPDYGSLLAVGDVDFRKRSAWRAETQVVPVEAATPTLGPTRGSFTDYWGPLPATAFESNVVHALHEDAFGGKGGEAGERTLLQKEEPSEERLKHELQRHSVLHLATHGFFQPEGTPSMWETALNQAGGHELRLRTDAATVVAKHPGLLSGLVCAGANRPGPEGDDGYLTAEEVGWLDLSGAELVVLSACETGLGSVKSGEGLIGLRRAFQIAGAKTVISSLWSVKDESTAELMRDFYKNLFLKGMGRHEALRSAQLAMLQRNRMEHGEALPSTWGAFVLSGEWR